MENFFKDRREELSLTQEGMAEILEMTQPAVSSWECFSAAPRLKSSEKLAKAYRVSRDRMEQEIIKLTRQIETKAARPCAKA
jgi:transcriptional regulator with XRE-family HTH domain